MEHAVPNTGGEPITEPYIGEDGQPLNPNFSWAVVEIFGHRRHAGAVTEVERFGSKLLRIDIPKTGEDGTADFANGFESHFYGGAAIFSMTLTDLASVLAANKKWGAPGRKSLPAPDEQDDIPDDTDDDDPDRL